jgi:hypothetical protein
MSADFERMASEAKAAHEARVARRVEQDQDRRQKDQDRRQKRSRSVHDAVAALTTHVLPILEQAAVEFHKQSIETKVTRNFDVENSIGRHPSVTFRCLGPRRSDGWQLEAPAAFFSSDGAIIWVGVANETYDRKPTEELGVAVPSDSGALVAQAVQRALNAYFAEIEKR